MTFDPDRFVDAQDRDGIHDRALSEIAAGQKRTHWMWFVFPQLEGLGHSPTARHFALPDLAAARDYLAHPVLGPRLRQAVETALGVEGRSAPEVFGGIDAMKLRSSLTLFARAAPDDPLFAHALDRYFDGPDERTLELLGDP